MYIDLLFPQNNEEELYKKAKELGFSLVIFAYEKKVPEKKLLFDDIFYITTKKIKKNPERKDFENKDTKFVFDMEIQEKEDFLHHRNSGLNHVLIDLAKKNKILIGFNFRSILLSKNQTKHIGRVIQNIKLVKFANVAIFSGAKAIYEMRSPKELINCFVSWKMNEIKAKESLSTLSLLVEETKDI